MAQKAPALQPALRPVRVFVAYSDCTSASRALAALNTHWRTVGQRVALRPMLWPFRQLAEPRWSDMAARDALHADCVLLAMDHSQTCESQVERWLAHLRAHAASAMLSIVVAMRDEELWNLSVAGNPPSSAITVGPMPAAEVLGSVAARRPVVAAA